MRKQIMAAVAAVGLALTMTACSSQPTIKPEYLKAAHESFDSPDDMTNAQIAIIGKRFCKLMDDGHTVLGASLSQLDRYNFSTNDVGVADAVGVYAFCPEYKPQMTKFSEQYGG